MKAYLQRIEYSSWRVSSYMIFILNYNNTLLYEIILSRLR